MRSNTTYRLTAKTVSWDFGLVLSTITMDSRRRRVAWLQRFLHIRLISRFSDVGRRVRGWAVSSTESLEGRAAFLDASCCIWRSCGDQREERGKIMYCPDGDRKIESQGDFAMCRIDRLGLVTWAVVCRVLERGASLLRCLFITIHLFFNILTWKLVLHILQFVAGLETPTQTPRAEGGVGIWERQAPTSFRFCRRRRNFGANLGRRATLFYTRRTFFSATKLG